MKLLIEAFCSFIVAGGLLYFLNMHNENTVHWLLAGLLKVNIYAFGAVTIFYGWWFSALLAYEVYMRVVKVMAGV